jgi:hypothetical protein
MASCHSMLGKSRQATLGTGACRFRRSLMDTSLRPTPLTVVNQRVFQCPSRGLMDSDTTSSSFLVALLVQFPSVTPFLAEKARSQDESAVTYRRRSVRRRPDWHKLCWSGRPSQAEKRNRRGPKSLKITTVNDIGGLLAAVNRRPRSFRRPDRESGPDSACVARSQRRRYGQVLLARDSEVLLAWDSEPCLLGARSRDPSEGKDGPRGPQCYSGTERTNQPNEKSCT